MIKLIEKCEFSAIDFEIMGDNENKSPQELGITTWKLGQKPQVAFSVSFQDSFSFSSVWKKIHPFLEKKIIVAHGHGMEKRMLRAFPKHHLGPWVDTLTISRAVFPKAKNHQLSYLCQKLKLEEKIKKEIPQSHWHQSDFDSFATLLLLKHIIENLDLAKEPLELLLKPKNSYYYRHRNSK